MARDYTSIITTEYSQGASPNFHALVSALGAAFGANFDVLANATPMYFDLDIAVGEQLDEIGLWVGAGRRVAVPLAIYFSLDIDNLGFDQGVWQGPFDPDTGLTILDDETFRIVLRAVIAFNNWDGTTKQYNENLAKAFVGTGTIVYAVDNQDMTMTLYQRGASLSPLMKALLLTGALHIKPAGVGINLGSSFYFGFAQSHTATGFDEGPFYKP